MTVLQEINRSQLTVKERVRKDYGDLTELKETLQSHIGQIQTLAIVQETEDKFTLLAGGRRVQALDEIHSFPDNDYRFLGRIYPSEITSIQRKEIELIENTSRLDLDWKERVSLTAEIHELQKQIHGTERPSRHDLNAGASTRRTAKLIGRGKARVVEELKLADAMEKIPELAKAKNQSEALNLLARIQEEMITKELALRAEAKIPKDNLAAFRKRVMDSYILGDFFEKVKEIPDESINLIDLDPPYVSAFESRDRLSSKDSKVIDAFKKKSFARWEDYNLWLTRTLEQCYRVLKPNGWLLCWYAQEPWAEETYQQLKYWNFQLDRIPAIWFKDITGKISSAPDKYLGRTYETFYYCRKGSPVIRQRGRSDIFIYKSPHHTDRIHPTEKPLALMEDIFRTFVQPGSDILVPFAGSGNSILAAYTQKMQAIGFDLGEEFRDGFIRRCEEFIPGI